QKSAVGIDRHIDYVAIVARVPGITRDSDAAGRVLAALIRWAAAAARECFRSIPRQICACTAKFHGYDVAQPVPQDCRRREVEPVIRLPIYVGQILAVLRGGCCSYQ